MQKPANRSLARVQTATIAPPVAVTQFDCDKALAAAWLAGRPDTTTAAYGRDVRSLIAFVGEDRPLRSITIAELQAWAEDLDARGLSAASRRRAIDAVRSLFTFGQASGYLPFNPATMLQRPKSKDTLAERIAPEEDIQAIIRAEPDARNRVLLRLLYAAGLRVSEVVGLTWADVKAQDAGGQITVYGKGGKTRHVFLPGSPAKVWAELVGIRPDDFLPTDPVFASRKGAGRLSTVQVFRIVQAAAKRAGVAGNVSPHWFRHAHVSHALDRGASVHVVQATVGHASLATTSRYSHVRPGESSARVLAV